MKGIVTHLQDIAGGREKKLHHRNMKFTVYDGKL